MAIIHAVRSDSSSFDARLSYGGKTPGMVLQSSAANPPIYEADAGAIGGNRINMDRSAAIARAIVWNAHQLQAVSTSRAISVLIRCKLGVNSSTLGIWHRDSGGGLNWGANRLGIQVTSANNWVVYANNEYGQTAINGTSFGTQNVGTSNWVDLLFTWDGTTSANAAKFYIDATLLGQATATGALNSTFDWRVCPSIWLGGGYGCNNARMYVNEMVVWDSVISDPTSVTLTSGTGSLNGNSRTAFVDVTALDGLSYSFPTAAQIKTGVSYTNAGTAGTGTYDGSDRWSDPGITNVRSGTAYKANSTINNMTGTCAVPTAAQTKTGVSVDATTGTYTGSDRWSDPGVSYVANGRQYQADSLTNNRTGTYNPAPSAADIADAVWDEATSGHTTAGTFGLLIQKLLTVAKFLGLK